MLKLDAKPLYKTLEASDEAFFGASKKVIVELRPTADEHHLLIWLKDERDPKRTLEKLSKKKVVKAVSIIFSRSLSEYDDVFYVDYFTPIKEGIRNVRGRPVPTLYD